MSGTFGSSILKENEWKSLYLTALSHQTKDNSKQSSGQIDTKLLNLANLIVI